MSASQQHHHQFCFVQLSERCTIGRENVTVAELTKSCPAKLMRICKRCVAHAPIGPPSFSNASHASKTLLGMLKGSRSAADETELAVNSPNGRCGGTKLRRRQFSWAKVWNSGLALATRTYKQLSCTAIYK